MNNTALPISSKLSTTQQNSDLNCSIQEKVALNRDNSNSTKAVFVFVNTIIQTRLFKTRLIDIITIFTGVGGLTVSIIQVFLKKDPASALIIAIFPLLALAALLFLSVEEKRKHFDSTN